MEGIAKVTPIFKNQGSVEHKQNYRPISVLPILSKLYERHLYEALYSHLSNNNFLYGLQSGFRKRHSTETALIRLLDQILLDLDKNHVTGVVFVDYSKAFDLIDHQLLLQKLSAYGVDDTSVRRFLQKTENRKPTGKNRKNRVNRVFLKIRSKIETTVKKDTTRYSDSRKILNVRCFEDVIKFQTNSPQFFVCKCQNVIQLHQTRISMVRFQ